MKIATLGPKGTFAELAACKYVEGLREDHEIVLFPKSRRSSIQQAMNVRGASYPLVRDREGV